MPPSGPQSAAARVLLDYCRYRPAIDDVAPEALRQPMIRIHTGDPVRDLSAAQTRGSPRRRIGCASRGVRC